MNTTDTFQVWLQRTNDLVTELGTSIVTASVAGDTTLGSAKLTGTFTSNNVVAGSLLRANAIDNVVGNTSPIDVRSQASFNSSTQTSVIVNNALGPRIKIQNNNIGWLMGVRGSAGTGTDAQFVVGVEGSSFAVRIGTDGALYANTIFLDTESSSSSGVVRASRSINTANGITGGGDLTANRTLGLTGNALAVHALSANGIVTKTASGTMTTRSIDAGSGITISNGNGVSGNPAVAVDSTVVLTLAGTQTVSGAKTFSSAAVFNGAVTCNSTLSVTGAAALGSTLSVVGDASFSSNVSIGLDDVISFNVDRLKISADAVNPRLQAQTNLYVDMVANGSTIIRNSASVAKFTLDTSTGNITAAGNITAYSDMRLKTNIRTIESALDKVQSLRGVYFDKDAKRGMGVIAQEVASVIPEVVEDDGEYMSVAYGNLVGVLIEAIKELKTEIEELKRV